MPTSTPQIHPSNSSIEPLQTACLKTLLKQNMVWIILERCLQIFALMLMNAWLSKSYSVQSFGLFQAYFSLMSSWQGLTFICGAETLIPRYIPKISEKIGLFQHAFYIRLAGCLVASISYAVYVIYSFNQNIWLGLAFLPFILITEAFWTFIAYLQVQTKQKQVSIIRIVAMLCRIAFIYVAIKQQWSIAWVASSFGFESVLISVLAYRAFKKAGLKLWVPIVPDLLKSLLKNGLMMAVGLITWMYFQRLDRLYLGHYGYNEILAYYGLAGVLFENWINCATLVAQLLGSILIFQPSHTAAYKNLKQLTAMFVALNTVMYILIKLFGLELLESMYGGNYASKSYQFLLDLMALGWLIFIEIALSLWILRYKNAYMYTLKWLLAFIASLAVCFFVDAKILIAKPWLIVSAGYVVACVYSLSFLIIKQKNHKESYKK